LGRADERCLLRENRSGPGFAMIIGGEYHRVIARTVRPTEPTNKSPAGLNRRG
jgi:hypothetical protein